MKPSAVQITTIAISSLLLAGVIVLWPDLYIFSKVSYIPAWAANLPDPSIATWGLAAIGLLPLWFGPSSPGKVALRFGLTIILGALLGVCAWCIPNDVGTPGNIFFQTLWVLVWGFFPPALILFAARAITSREARRNVKAP